MSSLPALTPPEAEEALRESEGWFRSLGSSVSDAICVLDADGAVQYSSPVADAMLAQARRLDVARIFARHLQALDPATEVPRDDVLFAGGDRRAHERGGRS